MQNTKDVISLCELRERLLSLNSNIDIPFSVIERDKKLVACWKIVDGKWIEILGMGGIKKQYELILLFDEATKLVSYREKSIDSEHEISADKCSFKKNVEYGNRKSFSFGASWGLKENGTVGKQYSYKFRTSDIKNPVFDIINKSGWILKQRCVDKYGLRLIWWAVVLIIISGITFQLI